MRAGRILDVGRRVGHWNLDSFNQLITSVFVDAWCMTLRPQKQCQIWTHCDIIRQFYLAIANNTQDVARLLFCFFCAYFVIVSPCYENHWLWIVSENPRPKWLTDVSSPGTNVGTSFAHDTCFQHFEPRIPYFWSDSTPPGCSGHRPKPKIEFRQSGCDHNFRTEERNHRRCTTSCNQGTPCGIEEASPCEMMLANILFKSLFSLWNLVFSNVISKLKYNKSQLHYQVRSG